MGEEEVTLDNSYLWIVAQHRVYVFLQLNDFIFFLKEWTFGTVLDRVQIVFVVIFKGYLQSTFSVHKSSRTLPSWMCWFSFLSASSQSKFVFGINFNSYLPPSRLRLSHFRLFPAEYLGQVFVTFSTCPLSPMFHLFTYCLVHCSFKVTMLNIPDDSRQTGCHSRGVELTADHYW